MTAAPPRTSRRGVLVGSLAVLATTGCDAVSPAPPSGAGARTTPPATTDTPSDPDEALVADVRTDLVEAFVLVASVVSARPRMSEELAPFVTLHARHLRALDGDEPRGDRRQVPGGAAEIRATVRTHEARLETSLASAALAAQSGPLAALLASMSAAVAQQLVATA